MKKLEEFERFQGNLKTMDRVQLSKLKASIVRNGFNAPIFVWKGHNYILDGHQRIFAVKALINRDKMVLENDELPYVEIEADGERQAKEMILTYNSQYGDVSPEALAELLGQIQLPTEELRSFVELPNVDLQEVMFHRTEGPEYQIVQRDMEDSEMQYMASQGGNSIWGVSKAYVRIGRYYFFVDHDMAEEIGLKLKEMGPKAFIKLILPEISGKRSRNIGPVWVLPPASEMAKQAAKRADTMTTEDLKKSEPDYTKRSYREQEVAGRPAVEKTEGVSDSEDK
jgi:hypothetical protein